MTRPLRCATAVAALGFLVASAVGSGLEVGATYPDGTYDGYPSDGFVATTEPWYYEGRASYWYGGQWYYRDGGRWNHYGREPDAFRMRRMQGALPRRRAFEPGARPGGVHGGGGRGGGRGGGGRGGGGGGHR